MIIQNHLFFVQINVHGFWWFVPPKISYCSVKCPPYMLAHHHKVLQRIFHNTLGWISCQYIRKRSIFLAEGNNSESLFCIIIVDSRHLITSWNFNNNAGYYYSLDARYHKYVYIFYRADFNIILRVMKQKANNFKFLNLHARNVRK